MGFDGVDFRGLGESLDITQLPAFKRLAGRTARQLADAGLAVSGISSSIRICDPASHEESLEEARRTIETAVGLDCPNVRVFGGGTIEEHDHAGLADIGAAFMQRVLELDGALRLHWVFETHDRWIRAADCRLLLERIPDPAFGVLWDMGHTARVGGETPADSLAAMDGRVGYTHVKDAVHETDHPSAMADGWRYVPPGEGQLPLREAIALLRGTGYDGWLLFEHEKRWHPDLAEPEDIFPKFVAWAREVLEEPAGESRV